MMAEIKGLQKTSLIDFPSLISCTIFISTCNFRCGFCYNKELVNDSEGLDNLSEEEIFSFLESKKKVLDGVCITGGEPLWQAEGLEQLVGRLKTGGYLITIETNGSFKPPRWYTLVDSWNADIKCPSSQVCGVSNEIWFKTRQQDQIKFVVSDEKDLEFVKQTLDKHKADSPTILLSPITKTLHGTNLEEDPVGWDKKWLQRVVKFCLENRCRFSLQWHKIVWGNKKGV